MDFGQFALCFCVGRNHHACVLAEPTHSTPQRHADRAHRGGNKNVAASKMPKRHHVVLIEPFPMNRLALLFIALTLVGVAFGQLTAVYFTDKECKNQPLWTVPPIFNPLTANLGICTKTIGNFYSRVTACASGSFTSSSYNSADTTCTGTAIATTTNNTNTCISLPSTVDGVNSYRVSCSSSAVLTATYFVDQACQTTASDKLGPSIPNPLEFKLNTCIKTAGGYNGKVATCASGSFSSTSYGIADTTCAGTALATTNDKTDTCIVLPAPVTGLNSYKLMCSSANPAKSLQSVVALFVAVALIAYF